MDVVYALFSAFFAAIMTILLKVTMMIDKESNPFGVMLIRTAIVFAISTIFTIFVTKESFSTSFNYHITLWLSAISMAGCWFFYLKALKTTNATIVGTFDKASIILTMILSVLFLKEKVTIMKGIAFSFFLVGTILIGYGRITKTNLIFCFLMLICSSLMAIFGKISTTYETNTFLSLSYRMFIVLGISLFLFFVQKKKATFKISKKGFFVLVLASFATVFSWLFYYQSLQLGETSIVTSITKLSIVIISIFSAFVFHEHLNFTNIFGLFFIVMANIILIFWNR